MRYLRRYNDEDGWEEITRQEMIEKLSHSFVLPEKLVELMEEGRQGEVQTSFAVYKVEV